jgi:hypothetical protein
MPSAERSPTEKTVAAMRRRVKPSSIVAELSDGKLQPIDLGETRGRWERIGRTLQSLDWIRVRCYSQPDGKGEILDTLENEEAGEETDDETPMDDVDARVRSLFESCAKHVDHVVTHLRKRDEDLENSRTAYIATLTERNMQLEQLAGDALVKLREATEMIAEAKIAAGGQYSDKERALLGAADALGSRFGAWQPGTLLGAAGPARLGPSNGSGKAAEETEGDL